MRNKKSILILLMFIFTASTFAQKENNDIRAGNKKYNNKKYIEAEVDYRKGLLKNPNSFEANYDLGNTLFRQKKYDEASKQFEKSAALSLHDKVKKAAAYHNLGNSLLLQNKIEESIEAYKNALRNNPKDNETRYNLAYAQLLLKNQKKNQDKNQNQQQQQNKDKNKEDQQNKNSQPPQMTKENAQQILDALMQDEKDALKKVKKQPIKESKSSDKDW
ncbi:MAG TPA: tetratricopeptide repeat protein [Paludibacteraceae bacterium]|nr:tetratricopeptide repeat protein [Paludibacteraceae bacterium]HPO67738.1 tetratricopeptide repeat protein [Paludibacteraceae bacterium]HRR62320.1 tetratricopeptide repeat protein [Paludibacteraceae bacterium]